MGADPTSELEALVRIWRNVRVFGVITVELLLAIFIVLVVTR